MPKASELGPWLERLPASLQEQFARGEREAFDRAIALSELFDPGLTARLDEVGATHHVSRRRSRYDLLAEVARRQLTDRGGR